MNNNHSPAFPCEQGLSKREYIAVLAMQGLLVNLGLDLAHDVDDAAETTVLFADKLLARLGEEP